MLNSRSCDVVDILIEIHRAKIIISCFKCTHRLLLDCDIDTDNYNYRCEKCGSLEGFISKDVYDHRVGKEIKCNIVPEVLFTI
jgi:hypothetical protein